MIRIDFTTINIKYWLYLILRIKQIIKNEARNLINLILQIYIQSGSIMHKLSAEMVTQWYT